MPRGNEEFHQIATVLEHICDVNGVTIGVLMPIKGQKSKCSAVSSPVPQ